jgi:hypothetical protein
MDGVTELKAISGWILPDGRWHAAEEWWHVSALYDLQDQHPQHFQTGLVEALKAGDEAKIRRAASEAGFIKISRQQMDLIALNLPQLRTLQKLLHLIDPEEEFIILLEHGNRQKNMAVERLLKLKSVAPVLA